MPVFLCAQFAAAKTTIKYMRIITDELYAQLVKILAQDEKVAVFQQLVLSKKAEPAADADETTVKEVKEK